MLPEMGHLETNKETELNKKYISAAFAMIAGLGISGNSLVKKI